MKITVYELDVVDQDALMQVDAATPPPVGATLYIQDRMTGLQFSRWEVARVHWAMERHGPGVVDYKVEVYVVKADTR